MLGRKITAVATQMIHPVPDSFATCPDDVRAILDGRLAALNRGEGLTTDELTERLRERRRRRGKPVDASSA